MVLPEIRFLQAAIVLAEELNYSEQRNGYISSNRL